MSGTPALIWCPFPAEGEARRVAGQLLDEGLIGCANILPGMISLFQWNGERGEDTEIGVLLKTDAALLQRAVERLSQLHPYDTPAITGWRTDASSQATCNWLGGLTGPTEREQEG